MAGMCRVAALILQYGADTKKKDAQGNNCLHRAILSDNSHVFRELLKAPKLALDDRNQDDHVPLWLALQQTEQMRKCAPWPLDLMNSSLTVPTTRRSEQASWSWLLSASKHGHIVMRVAER